MAQYNPVCVFDSTEYDFDIGAFDKDVLIDNLTFSVGDAIVNSGEIALAESLSVTDGLQFRLLLSEALDVIDDITNSANKALSEAVNVIDSKVLAGEKALAEAVNVIDSKINTAIMNLAESLNVIDSIIKRRLMVIRKIIVRVRGGSYESDIELED